MIQFLIPALLAVRAFVAAGTSARTDSIPWSYSFTVSPNPVTANDGRASVSFAPASAGLPGASGNGLTAAPLTGSGPTAAAFDSRGYMARPHLTDLAPSTAGTPSWPGAPSTAGTLSWPGALSGTGPFDLPNQLTNPGQTATLGPRQDSVPLGAFVPPPSGQTVQLSAGLSVARPSVPINQVPEPTSLLLAGAGLSALGARAWWRKRLARA
jgi:PEP-CTERM motif